MPPAKPPPPVPPPHGPLARFLAHPGEETSRFLHHLAHALVSLGLHAGLPLLVLFVAVAVAVGVLRRAATHRLAAGARLVHVLAPPEVDPAGAETLWTNLVALLRPAWRRLLGGQHHVSFEIVAGSVLAATLSAHRSATLAVHRAATLVEHGGALGTLSTVSPS